MWPSTYLKTLVSSITSVTFYIKILSRPVNFSLRFFLVSLVLLGWWQAVLFNANMLPTWQQYWSSSLQQLTTHYPNDLQFDWNAQKLSWTPNQPLSVPYPDVLTQSADASYLTSFPPLMAFFSPQEIEPSGFADALPHESLVVITPTRLFLNQTGGDWNQIDLANVPGFDQTFIINHQTLPATVANWQSTADGVFKLFRGLSFGLLPLSLIVSRLVTSGIDALLVYILFQLNGFRLRLTKVWQLSLHVLVVASLVEAVARWLYPNLTWPILAITTWIFFTYLLLVLRSRLATQPTNHAE